MSYRNHVPESSEQKGERFISFLAFLRLKHYITLHVFEIFIQQRSCQNHLFSLERCCFSLIFENGFLRICSAKVFLSKGA